MASDPSRGADIVAFSFQDTTLLEQTWGELLARVRDQASLRIIEQTDKAAASLESNPAPTALLIADPFLTTESPEIWASVIAYARAGGKVIVMGLFSSFVLPDKIAPFFAEAGLPWTRAEYYRTTTTLNPATTAALNEKLPTEYSQKAVFLDGVELSAKLYVSERGTEAAVTFAPVGEGWVGYVGDVNAEEGSTAAVLAMCGLAI